MIIPHPFEDPKDIDMLLSRSYNEQLLFMADCIKKKPNINIALRLNFIFNSGNFELNSNYFEGSLKINIKLDNEIFSPDSASGLFDVIEYRNCKNLPSILGLKFFYRLRKNQLYWELLTLGDYNGLFITVANKKELLRFANNNICEIPPVKGFIFYKEDDDIISLEYCGEPDLNI